MFPRTPTSPGFGPTLDLLRSEHLQEWRRAAQGVVRTYKEWCAADRGDRHHLYLSLLDAIGCEERAAQQLELDAKGDQS